MAAPRELELICAVLRLGTVFSVKTTRDGRVETLQEAIVEKKRHVNDRFRVDPSLVTLYVARDRGTGAWLNDDDALDAILQRDDEVGHQYNKMHASWALNDPAYFGDGTPPAHKAIHVLVALPCATDQPTGMWLLTGCMKNALQTSGVRCRLYSLAGCNLGYYDPARRALGAACAFWYEATTLCFRILFETKDHALRFDNGVRDEPMARGSPLGTLEVETHLVQAAAWATEPTRIYFQDYSPDDSESPHHSIFSVSSSCSVVDAATDTFRYQRIERDDLFLPYGKAESCHLVSRKQGLDNREFATYDRDPNNRLALSRDMHGFYDGMSCELPLVNIHFGSAETTPSDDNRYKVEIFVQVFDAHCISRVFSRLKSGSSETADPLTMKTFVHVKDPDTFLRCLEWKRQQNDAHWASFTSMTPAID